MERLQKLIASSGVCSRRHAEELIIQGRVKVNGIVVNTLGSKANFDDVIEVDGKTLEIEKKVYFMLNKPSGYITTSSDTHDRKTVIEIFKDVKERVFAVGRLDLDTTGLLIVTNDGETANHLIHPSFQVEKTYVALISPSINKNQLDILTKGVYLEDGFAKANSINILSKTASTTTVEIKVSIGKKHIVKRLLGYVGGETLQLHRISLGPLKLGDLEIGKYRELTEKEIESIKRL